MNKRLEHLNGIVTNVKRQNAQLEGENIQLKEEIGELNSRNVHDGQGAAFSYASRVPGKSFTYFNLWRWMCFLATLKYVTCCVTARPLYNYCSQVVNAA